MKLDVTLKRKIWTVNWPEGISPTKLAKHINCLCQSNVSSQLVNKWFKNRTVPDQYLAAVKHTTLNDVLINPKER